MDPTGQKLMTIFSHLSNIFSRVLNLLDNPESDLKIEVGQNPKGDCQRMFDLRVEEVVISYIKENWDASVLLLSEESGEVIVGDGPPKYRMVLDPVDGSENFVRDIPLTGIAIALFPIEVSIFIHTVEYAMVGDLSQKRLFLAKRGGGALRQSERDGSERKKIFSRRTDKIKSALISCELNHFYLSEPLADLLSQAAGVRTFGCATLALSMVAEGRLDVHIDLRRRLTAENFLAPSLLIQEAGGIITDPSGENLPEITDLKKGFGIVASANKRLHQEVIGFLKEKRRSTSSF
ncbi:MAG: hypothetical protein KAW16_00965 [candidate division Zixibacteria bacterium]|nr:hypothetical protein [candidate division Zixibacteria bacterium]